MADPGDELVEIVDVGGSVLDVVTRREMRAGDLRHRCTYVAVVTSAGELVVHQRADWKDVHPAYWDVAFGGVCGVGEGWLLSAQRELAEEAGITGVELEDLGGVTWGNIIVGRVFLACSDAELTCPDGEVQRVDRVAPGNLDRWLEGREVCLDSLDVVVPKLRARFVERGVGR
ncbi:MAG: NUDIX domain-containing protein [Actinomycetia bacterium]|nr:NUDIX domain-containing protein [Actinomycetes bacterium]